MHERLHLLGKMEEEVKKVSTKRVSDDMARREMAKRRPQEGSSCPEERGGRRNASFWRANEKRAKKG